MMRSRGSANSRKVDAVALQRMRKPDLIKRIKELEAEISGLREELEVSRMRERDLEETRKAMLYLLEDINKTTEAIEKAKKEWETTFDAINDPLMIHDNGLRIVRANKAYKEMAGRPYKEIIGRPYYKVFPVMDGPFPQCLEDASQWEEKQAETCLSPSGRVLKTRFYPFKDGEGRNTYFIHVMEDITEAKRAEDKFKQSLAQIRQEMEITSNLLMIAEATSNHTTEMERLIEEVMRCSCRIVRSDTCLSYLWDGGTMVFRPVHCCGLSHEVIPFFKTEPLSREISFVKEAMEGRRWVLVQLERFTEEWELLKMLGPMESVLVIPFTGRHDYLGIVFCFYNRPVEFAERERALISSISMQVSVALEEARLYKDSLNRTMELSRKIETIRVMHEIDLSLLSTLEPREVLESAVRMISRVISCDRATIALVDRENGKLSYAAGFGIGFIPKGTCVPFEDTSLSEVIRTGSPQYVADLVEEKELLPVERALVKEGFLSHIRVPLFVKGEVIGVLTVGAKRSSAFSSEELSTVEKIAAQLAVALENARLVEDLEQLFIGTVRSLSEAVDAKSKWTAGHSRRVTAIALDIGRELALDDKSLKRLELAGLLHDVGKIGTYEHILDKPGKLSQEEEKIMKEHPVKGAGILRPIKQLADILPAIRHHHENHDGTGYPDGVKGDDIPLFARILAVADTVDAMASDRPYRKGRGMDVIVQELKRCSGTQFDPLVVDAFIRTLEVRL